MLELMIEDVKFEFCIEKYKPSTQQKWDDEWCNKAMLYIMIYIRNVCCAVKLNGYMKSSENYKTG